MITAFAIIVSLVIPATTLNVSAQDVLLETTEQKIYSQVTLDEDFADNRVIVVMNHNVSMYLNDYDIDDFAEINAKSITDLASATREKAHSAFVYSHKIPFAALTHSAKYGIIWLNIVQNSIF